MKFPIWSGCADYINLAKCGHASARFRSLQPTAMSIRTMQSCTPVTAIFQPYDLKFKISEGRTSLVRVVKSSVKSTVIASLKSLIPEAHHNTIDNVLHDAEVILVPRESK